MDLTNSKRDNLLLVGGIVFGFIVYPVIFHLLFAGEVASASNLFYSRLIFWLWVILLYLYARKVEHNNYLLWKDKPYGFWYYVGSVCVLYLLCICGGIISVIPRFFGWTENDQMMLMLKNLVSKNMPLLIFSAITAGITEELLFRGYLVPRLELLFKNKFMPVIVSALVFAAMHYRYKSLYESIFTLLFGIIFALHYQRYRNIKILMITHAMVDLISFLLYRQLHTTVHLK